jgi:hypothetical protein
MHSPSLLPTETRELRAHLDRAAKARREGVQLLRDRRDGRHYATSATTPGTRYFVTLLSCTCPGFLHYGHCKHHSALVVAHLIQEGAPEPDGFEPLAAETVPGPVVTPIAPNAGIDRITNPATGELLGWVRASRYSIEAFDAADRFLGEYRGVDAHTRASDRVWRAYEAKRPRQAA